MGKRYTIEHAKDVAVSRGGKCLSSIYSYNEKLEWKCGCGYIWLARFNGIINGSWCPKCAGNIKFTIDDVIDFAKKKNGKCLSLNYTNNAQKLKWECNKCGHIWQTSFGKVRNGGDSGNGTWCPKCAGQIKFTIEMAQEIAKNRNGLCLSLFVSNKREKLDWKCNICNYKWSASLDGIKNCGTWCPKCAGQERVTIEKARELAISRGGKCLSNNIKNSGSKLKWACMFGHIWEASYTNIKRCRWCPDCKNTFSEKVCRYLFETYFKHVFKKTRPSWLINPKTKCKLELDGFCKELNIAFEYNGTHHYKIVKKYKMTKESLREVKERDRVKVKLCKLNNVNLFVIKEIGQDTPTVLQNIFKQFKKICKKYKIKFNINDININSLYLL